MPISERVRKLLLYKKYIDFCLEKELTGEYPRWGNQESDGDNGQRSERLGGDANASDSEASGKATSRAQ